MSRLSVRQVTTHAADPVHVVADVCRVVRDPDLCAVLFFCSPRLDLPRLAALLDDEFRVPVVGCTSAGQIGAAGFERGGFTAVGLVSRELQLHPHLIAPLSAAAERASAIASAVQADLARATPGTRAFGLLLADGLGLAEEQLAAALYEALGNVPVIGGSAADDLAFDRTHVYHRGAFHSDAAVFAAVTTTLPFQAFKLQHFAPTASRLIVTDADPARRLVRAFDGLPAVEAYASAIGVPADRLDATVFSAHPVLVSIDGEHYVRSIQRTHADGSLTFFCRVELGEILYVGRELDALDSLARTLGRLEQQDQEPEVVIGCDCILRRLAFERSGIADEVGRMMASHRVVGFSTYGEQFNAVHVNQTFTGIALGTRARAA